MLTFKIDIVNPSRLAYKGRCFHELWKYDMFQRGLPSWNWHISITSENTFLYRPAVMDSVSHTLLNKSKFISYQTFHQTSAGKRYLTKSLRFASAYACAKYVSRHPYVIWRRVLEKRFLSAFGVHLTMNNRHLYVVRKPIFTRNSLNV